MIQTISEFEKEIELLQTQKIDVEKHVQSQKREMRGNKDMSHCLWDADRVTIGVSLQKRCRL